MAYSCSAALSATYRTLSRSLPKGRCGPCFSMMPNGSRQVPCARAMPSLKSAAVSSSQWTESFACEALSTWMASSMDVYTNPPREAGEGSDKWNTASARRQRGSGAPPAPRDDCPSRRGDRGHGHRAELQVARHEVLRRIQHLVPGDFLPGVGGLAPHDRGERALGHLTAFVERMAGTDAGDQISVLLHVRVGLRRLRIRLPAPWRRALDDGVSVACAPGAREPLDDPRRRVLDLAPHALHPRPARILEFDGEVIEDVAIGGVGARLAPTHAHRLHGMCAEHPVRHVDVVHVLLHDVVARQPREVEPVPDLPLHVGPRRLTRVHPQAALVPVDLAADEVADAAVVDALDRRAVARVVAPLRAGHDGEPFLGGEVGGRHDGAYAARVHG